MRSPWDCHTPWFHEPVELDDFGEALSALVSAGAQNYGDCTSIEVLHRELARFEAFVTEATAAFEAGEEWAADCAKNQRDRRERPPPSSVTAV